MGGRGGGAKTHSLPKICHLYPIKMTLGKIMPYLKKTQKIYESRDTPHIHTHIGSADISFFDQKSAHFAIPGNAKYRLHFST